MNDPPLSVSLTTLPSRIALLEPTLDSLLAQSRRPDHFYVCVPHHSLRERAPYVLPGFLTANPRIEVIRCRDYGPATKLLGCLDRIPHPSCLVVVDDDLVYEPFVLERLYDAQRANPRCSYSFHVYDIGRIRIGQGADGLSFHSVNLEGIGEFARLALASPDLFVFDDLWISVFLANRRVSIRSLQHTLSGPTCYAHAHRVNQLRDVEGTLRRSQAFERGFAYLLQSGALRWALRARYRMPLARVVFRKLLGRPAKNGRRPAPGS